MDFETLYKNRRARVSAYMKEHGIKAAVFEDSEDRRESILQAILRMHCFLLPTTETAC